MEIHIRGDSVEATEAVRAHVTRRLGFALSRFDEHIGRITVDLSTVQEHQPSAEQRCQIRVALRRVVRVQESDSAVLIAVDRAIDRVSRSVASNVDLDRPTLSTTNAAATKRRKATRVEK